MAERKLEDLPFRELLKASEHLTRELAEHVKSAVLLKNRQVLDMVSANQSDSISDMAVHSQVAAVLSSDDFAQELLHKLDQHLAALDKRAQRAVNNRP